MASARTRQRDVELTRLQTALRANEQLMQEAAINYENLVAAKEDLLAAIKAHRDLRLKKTAGQLNSAPASQHQSASQSSRD